MSGDARACACPGQRVCGGIREEIWNSGSLVALLRLLTLEG
ncbi:MAG: hypothetical protein ACRDPY_40860 [Streptosporangiaceae bacterium]